MSFFKLLKKEGDFQLTDEAQEAFKKIKVFLTSPPILTAPDQEEPLLLYIAATTHVVSTIIVVERPTERHVYPLQRQVYFVSKVLRPSKVRYPRVQKLLYALLLTVRKLKNYFQAHSITVVSEFLIGDILRKKAPLLPSPLASNILFKASNNAAEYEAMLHGLRIAISIGIKQHMVYGDSKLAISQVNRDWSCTNDKMDAYCSKVMLIDDQVDDWRKPIINYIVHGQVTSNKTEAERIS
ncbi:uncharacterized protein [Setaria viridis]|uniref:uncharacterized protein n=1 Tax=Setaria viridis TaxID=4556 RepID=UPI003B3B8920